MYAERRSRRAGRRCRPSGGAPGGEAGDADDDVVDAEIVEEDDKK